nr:uncharacterized protein LOC127337578 [Lolium perenne]
MAPTPATQPPLPVRSSFRRVGHCTQAPPLRRWQARAAPRRKAPSTKRPYIGAASVTSPKKAKAPASRRPQPPPPPPLTNQTPPSPPSGNPAGAHTVHDEMPERVDDDTFMETMNVGSSFMHDEAVEGYEEYEDVDEEGEGLIKPRHPGRPTFGGGMTGMGGMAGMGSMPIPAMGGMAGMGGYGGMAGIRGSSYGGVFGGTMGSSVSAVYGEYGSITRRICVFHECYYSFFNPKMTRKKKKVLT